MPDLEPKLAERAAAILAAEWERIEKAAGSGAVPRPLADPKLAKAIRGSIRSKTKTYRYVLPTQLVAKLADGSLDCRCLQSKRGGKGAFDARTVAHAVVVPFDQTHHHVLGGSPEPYVNNPLRVPEVSRKYVGAQKDAEGWRLLCAVLEAVECSPELLQPSFQQTLAEIHELLAETAIDFPLPNRASLQQTLQVLNDFLSERSGGERMQAVSAAF